MSFFNHSSIGGHKEQLQPSLHGAFISSIFWSLWEEIQKEYDKVFIFFFKKSGNHNSSVTKSAMDVYQREGLEDNESVMAELVISVDIHCNYLFSFMTKWVAGANWIYQSGNSR